MVPPYYKLVLGLIRRADLDVRRARRLGIYNLSEKVTQLRKKGHDIRLVATGTYAYYPPRAEPKDINNGIITSAASRKAKTG